MKPKFFFDYVYYRIAKAYFKWDGQTGITAITAISGIQTLIVFEIVYFALHFLFDGEVIAPFSKAISYCVVALFLLFMFINYKKYNQVFEVLKNYWKDEPPRLRILKGIAVLASVVLPWAVLLW